MKDDWKEFLKEYLKDILTDDERNAIRRHLKAMKCDPEKIEGFISFLEGTELRQMKNGVLPHYDGELKNCVLGFDTKDRRWYLTKDDISDIQKAIEKTLKLFRRFHFDRDIYLFPVYRNFYHSGDFGNVAGEVSDKIKAAYPALSELQSLLKKSVEMASFTKKGRTPKEGGSDFAYHIVHHFFMTFNKLPKVRARAGHFEEVVSVCYRAVGIESKDLFKTVSKAVERYRVEISRQ